VAVVDGAVTEAVEDAAGMADLEVDRMQMGTQVRMG
jgi:hypothetical protein